MSALKHFFAWIPLFYLIWPCRSMEHINEFAVHIPGPPEWADHVAAMYGFINKGQVGSLHGYYRFEHNGIQKRSLTPSKYYESLLLNDSKVHWCEQQVVKKRVKRSLISSEFMHFTDPLYPEQWFLHSDYGGYDMNVEPAWARGYSGKGIVVSILDDGIQGSHPDLALNYDKEASWDINDDDEDPTPKDDDNNRHGTRCAGEVAAVANNEFCGVGIAYNSRIGGVRMLDGRVTDTIEATALSLKINHIHIYSASWGPEDDGKTVDGPGPLAKIAFENGIKKGRNRLGSIFVWASGNGGKQSDSCNCDGYTNSIFTISVSSATEHGYKPWYLEECSSTLATTYSSGTTSTDRDIVTVDVNYDYLEKLKKGGRPNPNGLCTKKHTGTSASAPIAAGLCALALEANPELTWRDMQYIIVITSRYNPLSKEEGWITNGVNRKVSTKFGYGLMDGDAMVKVATRWKTLDDQHICSTLPDEIRRPISKRKGEYVEATIYTDGCEHSRNFVRYAEHVQVRVTLSFHPRGNLHIILVSPKNTSSSLLFPRPHDAEANQDSFNDWPFMSVHFWGEEIIGAWKLIIHNVGKNSAQHSGTLIKWSITFYGTEDLPDCVRNNSCMVDEKTEEKHFEKQSFQVRGISGSAHVNVEICKESNKFLYALSSVKKHCVSVCPPGFYASTKDYLCHECNESCNSCYGPSHNNCLTCRSSQYLQNSACVNKCPDKYLPTSLSTMQFNIFQQCVPCADSCLTCEDQMHKCNSCKEGFHLVQHKCLSYCPSGTFKKDKKCLPCSPGCTACFGAFSDNCLACSPQYYLVHHSCETACPLRYFADGKGRCIPCHRSCETCDSQDHCLTCVEGKYQRRENEGLCEAVACDQLSENFPKCSSECFMSGCAVCLQPMSCEICKENSLWWYDKCIYECPVSDYAFFDECRNCGGMCFTCVGNPHHCTLCREGFYLHQNNCYSICPVGFFGTEEGVCKACHPSCKECDGNTEFQCLSCPAENYLLNSSCTSSCPLSYYPVVYSFNRIDGFQDADINSEYEIIEVKVCKQCHATCKTCTEYGPHSCISCFPDRTLTDNTCMPCLYGDFFNYHEKVCQKCDLQCSTCFGPSHTECSSCTPPFRLHKEKHLCLPCCLSESGEDCCMCNNNLDYCVIPQKRLSWQVATFAIVISIVVIIIFVIIFAILQYRSKRSWHHGFRGRKYIPVPRELNATFNADQEKVCLTQEEADEEDEIFLKT